MAFPKIPPKSFFKMEKQMYFYYELRLKILFLKEKNAQPSPLSVVNLNVTQKGFLPVLRAALTSITDDYKDKTVAFIHLLFFF